VIADMRSWKRKSTAVHLWNSEHLFGYTLWQTGTWIVPGVSRVAESGHGNGK
jgi:hypothetical protein